MIFNVLYATKFVWGMSQQDTTIELKKFFWVFRCVINKLLVKPYMDLIPFLFIILAARLPWSGSAIAAWPVVVERMKFTCRATPAILCMGYGPFMDWFHIYLSILTPFPFDWLCVTFVSVTYTKWDGSELWFTI